MRITVRSLHRSFCLAACLGAAGLAGAAPVEQEAGEEARLRQAVRLAGAGETAGALAVLAELASTGATEVLRQEAALAGGRLLLDAGRPAEAAALLEAAVAPDPALRPYAQLLRAEALVAAGDAPEEALELAEAAAPGGGSGTLARRAAFVRVQALAAAGRADVAAAAADAYAARFADDPRTDEALWRAAEALAAAGQPRAAFRRYRSLWFDRPSSPLAEDARAAGRALAAAEGFDWAPPTGRKGLRFVRELQAAGRHAPALEQLERIDDAVDPDEQLWRTAYSAWALRRNDQALAAAERLWNEHPRSRWRPPAALTALRTARRLDVTPLVRQWVERIATDYAGKPAARDARLALATHLANAALLRPLDAAERSDVLAEAARLYDALLAEEDLSGADEREALWRRAWLELQRGNVPAARTFVERLLRRHPDSDYRGAALFWSGNLLLREGEIEEGAARLSALRAEQPFTWYGHRAGERLVQLGYEVPTGGIGAAFPPVAEREDDGSVPRDELARRLAALGLFELAVDELPAAADRAARFELIVLRSAGGDTRGAVLALDRLFPGFADGAGIDVPASYWRVRYPLHHVDELKRAADAAGVDPWLLAALIRNESFFESRATSPVGAVGLTQLMPATARELAAAAGVPAPEGAALYEPATNLRLGARYLAGLLEAFDGNAAAAVASYNAGPEAVRGWLERIPSTDLDTWIERIPFPATRVYVKKVLADREEYRRVYAGETAASYAAGTAGDAVH
jgi:soluble lytic murein transglycosylase